MTAATITRAEFLKAEERSVAASAAGVQAAWGTLARDTAQSSALALEAAASAEASRQLGLLDEVLAEDSVVIEGVHFDLEGETVRLSYLRPDGGRYFGAAADEVDLLVVSARVDLRAGTTQLRGFVRP